MISEAYIYRLILEAAKQRSRVSYDPATIHVSEVVSCLRKTYYYRTRLTQISPIQALKILGNRLHEAVQEVLNGRGYIVEHEVKLRSGEVTLVGHIDAYSPDGDHIIELKTVSKIPDEPYSQHRRQAQIYLELSRVPKAYIVYISRLDGRVRVFRILRDKKILRWAFERARKLHSHLAERKAPDRERSILCSYCEFKSICLGMGGRG